MPISDILTTTIELPANAVKSLLFSFSALLVQLTISNIFSLIAFRYDAFTSYLIFSEPLGQKLIYILRRKSFLVLSFLVLFSAGGLWGTVLWGLDHPGFVLHPHRVSADTLAKHRRPNPAYAIMSQSAAGNIDGLDIVSDLGAGLFEGINVTLTSLVAPGHPQIAGKPSWKQKANGDGSSGAGSVFPGTRIYLDDDGWSVGIDVLGGVVLSGICLQTNTSVADARWGCEVDYTNNTRVGADYFQDPLAVPDVWWSNASGLLEYETVSADRVTNPWHVLGTGGDTLMMKMVFSLARGHRKHTFMVSVMKTTLLAFLGAPIQMADVQDLVQRTWRAGDGAALQTQDLDSIGIVVGKGVNGLTIGRQHSDGYKVTSRVYQLQKTIAGTAIAYTSFQILDVNLTLINSETVEQVPTPFEDCDTWYQNEAYGGVVRGTNCFLAARGDGKTRLFQGETDTMSVFILAGTLGGKRSTTAADALNDAAWRWTQDNNKALEDLLLSRAYILAGNAGSVKVDESILRPAVSILQLVLVLLPVVLFLVSWGVVLGWVEWHFQASLFSNLVATTHEGYNEEKPGYMSEPPKLGIVRAEGRVYLGTETGVFWHTGRPIVWVEPPRVQA